MVTSVLDEKPAMKGKPTALRAMSLQGQFAVTGGLIMIMAMMLAGWFTSGVMTRYAVENTATASALFMDSLLSPVLEDLATHDILPADHAAVLDDILNDPSFENRFPHLEVWKPDGLVAYSRDPALIGKRFAPPEGLTVALGGKISAQYTDLEAGEHTIRDFTESYLEIYVPVREHLSGRIIAVAEIHEATTALEQRLWRIRLHSWAAVGGATLLVMAGLFGVVYRGGRTIDSQRTSLMLRIAEIEKVSRQNRTLRERAQRASSRLAESNERYLRQVGAELHDGPAQLLGLAALKVEHVRRATTQEVREKELQAMSSALAEALRDVRAISKGLMLPEIEHLPLSELVDQVVRIHEKRTATKVAVHCDVPDVDLSHSIKICVYRFIQEGLNNAFRHAGGQGQAVRCAFDTPVLTVAVEDNGGRSTTQSGTVQSGAGLGLTGLRERVESLGGTFSIRMGEGKGTRIEMSLAVMGDS